MAKSSQLATSFAPYPAPDFELPSSDGTLVRMQDLRGHWVVLFLYPTDDTEICTREACEFSAALPEFEIRGVKLFGLSKDGLASHEKFIRKYGLKMPLLSDETTSVINALGAWGEKSLYGRKYLGTDRSTFIVDPEGCVRYAWRKVRVKNHVTEVLTVITSLQP
ncbi:peroxiredoxin [Asticcacaulis sp. AC402]|uniref:peroxiredoxin n=1 Tax=Asticcacaulis sp. AC402 TaxID=1282361 RepID=UPI0003C40BD1|nr:peroxiredoxin [Asticcacaulis sp. AC402]ESQ76437.1 peroxiredoxin [Asticcacaulis sp. AC402]